MPLSAAPIVPATCVPWPWSSTSGPSAHDWSASSAHGPSTTSPFGAVGMSNVKLRDSDLLKFGAMSGCDPSMPVSMMPTRTARLPWLRAYEPSGVAPIMRMSHWAP